MVQSISRVEWKTVFTSISFCIYFNSTI